jgi:WhiB family redox-sensing transcriptional regulator
MNGRVPVDPDEFFTQVAAGLDRFELVPDDVLSEVVTRDGSCMELYRLDLEPEWSGDELTDRETAAQICAGCPVRRECLELELRTSGDATLGVWGALAAEDVRTVYPVWRSRRRRRGGLLGDGSGEETGEAGARGGEGA